MPGDQVGLGVSPARPKYAPMCPRALFSLFPWVHQSPWGTRRRGNTLQPVLSGFTISSSVPFLLHNIW